MWLGALVASTACSALTDTGDHVFGELESGITGDCTAREAGCPSDASTGMDAEGGAPKPPRDDAGGDSGGDGDGDGDANSDAGGSGDGDADIDPGGSGGTGGSEPAPVIDHCPQDDAKLEPGVCGCGLPDVDRDSDQTLDCSDACDDDPDKTAPGLCGCGVADTDSDSDETPDCDDACANDPNKIFAGTCGCGVADSDRDGDETPDCDDACADNPELIVPGACACGFTEPQTYCSAIPFLPSSPVIDGVLECELPLLNVTPVGWTNPNVSLPPGNAARYAAGWRPNGLYLYVEVDDPDLDPAVAGAEYFCGDAVQISVDADGELHPFHDEPGTRQIEVRAPDPGDTVERSARVYSHPADTTWTQHGAWTETQNYAAYPRTGGYVVEALITAAALGLSSWSPSGSLGFGLGITVSDSTGMNEQYLERCTTGVASRKLGQYYLRLAPFAARPMSCPSGAPWCTSLAFCAPELLETD